MDSIVIVEMLELIGENERVFNRRRATTQRHTSFTFSLVIRFPIIFKTTFSISLPPPPNSAVETVANPPLVRNLMLLNASNGIQSTPLALNPYFFDVFS
jgi:hypothetical protein